MVHSNELRAIVLRAPWSRVATAILIMVTLFGSSGPVSAVTRSLPPLVLDSALGRAQVFEIQDRVDHELLLAEDARRNAAGLVGPLRYASRIETEISTASAGSWVTLDGGWELWRIELVTQGAFNTSLYAGRFTLPALAELWIHDRNGAQVRGPFTGADVDRSGGLKLPLIVGDAIVIELLVPPGAREQTALEISTVYHGYRPLGSHADSKIRGSCNVNVVCEEGNQWRQQIRSAALVLTGQYACSGNLLNNTAEDQRPLFITAGHCAISASNAHMVDFYWNFEADDCDEYQQGRLWEFSEYQTGATHLASWGTVDPYFSTWGSDLTLLELDDTPDPAYNVFYAGWDTTTTLPSGAVVIHHPDGDLKSISFEDDPLTNTHYLDPELGQYGDRNWLRVNDWDLGTTEGGSSGSCLFDQQTKRCVATLSGGYAACGNDDADWFGWLAKGWEGGGSADSRLRDHLDPLNSGATFVDGLDPSGGGTSFDNVWLLPAAASTPGYGNANWKSQISIVNHTTSTRQASVYYVAGGQQWPGEMLSGPHTIAPRATVYLDDPLLSKNPTSGLVFVSLDQPGPLVSSRTFSLDPSGETYGQGIPGLELAAQSSPNELILPLAQNSPGGFHSNLGLVQTGTGSYSVQVTLYSRNGTPLGQKTYSQSAAFRQINNLFSDLGQASQSASGAWVRVILTGGSPTFWTAYLSVVDDLSHDPTFIAGVEP